MQRNNPGIDWVERLITFHPDEESRRYTVSGVPDWDVRESKPEWLLSAVQMANVLRDPANVVYLGTSVSEGGESPGEKEILDTDESEAVKSEMLRRYPDVFPSELPALSQQDSAKAGISHKIDLVPGSQPVFLGPFTGCP